MLDSALDPAVASNPMTAWAKRAAETGVEPSDLLVPIRSMIERGQLTEAEVLLDAAQFRFPTQASFAVEAARCAQRRGDAAAALQRWAAVRERFPDEPQGWSGAALVHRAAGAFEAADAMLAQAMERFPEVAWLAFDYGWVAHLRRDWPEAVRRWDAVRARSPEAAVGYLQGAAALRELQRHDEAEALLDEAVRRFPGDRHVPVERAWLALARGDMAEAARRWETARSVNPDDEAAYTGAARALRELGRSEEADRLLEQAMARFPGRRGPVTEFAWRAHVRRDWAAAAERWATVRSAFPDNSEAYVQGARALAQLWRHDDADSLLAAGVAALPNAAEIAVEHAWLAYRQSRWPEAIERFAYIRGRFPGVADGWLGGAMTLRNQSRFGEADALLSAGMERLPGDPHVALEHALLPVFPIFAADKDRPESLRRIEALRARFPNFAPGWVQGVRLLRDDGQKAAAEALAGQGAAALPGSIELAVTYANAALEREDWAAAAERFATLATRFPGSPEGPVGQARALAHAGNFEAADTMLRAVMERFPQMTAPFAEFGEVAVRRQDWPEAARRWADAEARFPSEKVFSHRLYEARTRMMEDEGADPALAATMQAHLAPAARPDETTVDAQVRELVMQFENLGGRGLGCEFGIFQRDCGAEPLGLLRWADMPYEGLAQVLETRFAGVGDPENTELFLSAISGGRGEYCTRDRRGFMFMRAFVYEDEVAFDKMYGSSCRRLKFLTRKMIEDLEQGSKIFVFRVTDRNLEDAQIDRLHRAMQAYGDNMLLYVRYQDEAHPNGTVELVKPGLMVGYIDRFKMSPTGELSAAPPTASWLRICQNAYPLWLRPERS